MDIALYILSMIALVALLWLIIIAIRTFHSADKLISDSTTILGDIKKDITQMTSDVTILRIHAVPVLDNVAEITKNIATITDGIAPRVEAIYETVDDTLNVVRGALDDIERIKDSVVATIESPLNLVRKTSTGVVGTVIKGIGVVRDLIGEFSKNGKD
ncbi:MAG: hypothetical protein ABI778_09305 [Ignavibacteriota bacterium]